LVTLGAAAGEIAVAFAGADDAALVARGVVSLAAAVFLAVLTDLFAGDGFFAGDDLGVVAFFAGDAFSTRVVFLGDGSLN